MNDLTQNKIKFIDFCKELLADGKSINLAYLPHKLKEIGITNYKEQLTDGKKLSNWIEAECASLLTIRDNVLSLRDENTIYSKEDFVAACTKIFTERDTIFFPALPSYLLEHMGITDYKKQLTGGLGLEAWVRNNCLDVFSLNEAENGITMPKAVRVFTRDEFVEIANKLLNEKGIIYFPSLPEYLKPFGVLDYRKQLTGGVGIGIWVNTNFRDEFTFTKAGNGIMLPGCEEAEGVSKEINLEIAQLGAIAVVGSWDEYSKLFQKYTRQLKGKHHWSTLVATGFANALLGGNDIAHYVTDGNLKIVFYTGISSESGNGIYGVLSANGDSTEGSPYSLEGFCCVSEEDSDLSREIRANAPNILTSGTNTGSKYKELRAVWEILTQTKEKLTSLTDDLAKAVIRGSAIDAHTFNLIKSYFDKWDHANKIIEFLGVNIDGPEGLTLEALDAFLSNTNEKSTYFDDTKKLFTTFLGELKAHFAANAFFADIVAEDISLVEKCTLDTYSDLNVIACRYRDLMHLTEYPEFTSEAAELFNNMNMAFRGNLLAAAFINKSAEAVGVTDKTVPLKVLTDLSTLSVSASVEDDTDETVSVSCEELFATVIDGTTADEFAGIVPLIPHFCTDDFERALALGNIDKCNTLLENPSLSFDRSKEDILAALEGELPAGRSLYECGKRIYNVIGNRNRCAEKYFISGLMGDAANCARELLRIYADRNDIDNFYLLYDKYGDSAASSQSVDEIFLLKVLCTKDPEQLKHYLLGHLYTLYIPRYSDAIRELLLQYEHEDVLALFDECDIPDTPQNQFEARVLLAKTREDFADLSAYISTSDEELISLGYTREELSNMQAVLVLTDTEAEFKNPIAGLYALQKNKNGTVERLIWESLAQRYSEELSVILLGILKDADRFYELQLLYECYEEKLVSNKRARELYIISLINRPEDKLYSFVCTNMQDFMSLMADGVITTDDLLRAQRFIENDKLFTTLVELSAYLDDTVLKSIITMSDRLREFAMDTSLLAEFDLSAERLESFVFAYKAGNFDRGRNVLSVAKRLFTFIGCEKGAAKAFALLSLDFGYNAFAALWKIYDAENNRVGKLALLTKFPEQQAENMSEYRALLLEKPDYSAFLASITEDEEVSSELAVQITIAKCNLNQELSHDLLTGKLSEVAPLWVQKMFSAMFDANHTAELTTFLDTRFDEMLCTYTAEEVALMVTALPEAFLKTLQKECENKKLTYYLFENLGLGRYKAKSGAFFSQMLELYADAEDKTALSRQIKTIYGKNDALITDLTLLEISHILENHKDAASLSEAVSQLVLDTALTNECMSRLLATLADTDIVLTHQLWMTIIDKCTELNMEKECFDFINALPAFYLTDGKAEFLNLLCKLYSAALENGYFDTSCSDRAITLCHKLLDTEYSTEALLCAYNLQKHLGNSDFAKFNLLMLNEKKIDALQEKLSAEYEYQQMTVNTNVLSLFIDMANSSSIAEIREYCTYCGKFVRDASGLEDIFYGMQDEKSENYSLDISVVLLKLLYHTPDSAKYWQECLKLPIDTTSAAYAKLMYCACLAGNDTKLWESCLDTCEQYCESIFPRVLISFAESIDDRRYFGTFRGLLADKIKIDPGYLSPLSEEDSLLLTKLLCKQMDTYALKNHAPIRDLYIITIATDSQDAFKYMMEYIDQSMFNNTRELAFAIACRLLLQKRFSEAKELLEKTLHVSPFKYKKLIEKLALMTEEELELWSAEPVNQKLIGMVLPDGNYPSIDDIHQFAFSSIDNAEEGAYLLCEILDNNPADYGCHLALFTLCAQLPHRIDLLHKALRGLVSNEQGNSLSYYSLSRKDYAILLGYVNAYIRSQGKTNEIEDYDFRMSAKEFYQTYVSDFGNDAKLDEIQAQEDRITNLLINRTKSELDLMYKAIFSYVTGNWGDLLADCFKNKVEIASYLSYYPEIRNGLTRSILKTIYSFEGEEQALFCDWLKEHIVPVFPENSFASRQLKYALYLHKRGYYAKLPLDIFEVPFLDIPFEENSALDIIQKNTIKQVISKAPEAVFPCAVLFSFLSHSEVALRKLLPKAYHSFVASNDAVSYAIYSAIHEFAKKSHIGAPSMNYQNDHEKRTAPRKNIEEIEAMMRLAGAFSGATAITTKISHSNFHSWSCLNMVFSLLYTPRANEVNRLIAFFAPNNRELAKAILTIVDKNAEDSVKIDAITALEDTVAQGLLCYAMTRKLGTELAFLKNNDSLDTILQVYNRIASSNAQDFTYSPVTTSYNPLHYVSVEPYRIKWDLVSTQLECDDRQEELPLIPTDTPREKAPQAYELSFVSDLSPIDSTEDTNELWTEHENILSSRLENRENRLALSEKLYCIMLGRGVPREQLADYAMRYGVDLYRVYMAKKDYTSANSVILELVQSFNPQISSVGSRMLKDTVVNTALHELLLRGYSNIYDMVEGYVKYKDAFITMRNMLPNSMNNELLNVNSIYSALEVIAKHLTDATEQNSAGYKEALVNAKKKLVGPRTNWIDVRQAVLNMIQTEINNIDRRPVLDFIIESTTAPSREDAVYGYVKNKGNDTATNIKLQLVSDTCTSETYILPRLEKGESAVFCIRFKADDDATQFYYSLAITYEHNAEIYNENIDNQSLIIDEGSYVPFSTNAYKLDSSVSDFKLDENGMLHSEHFFGRDSETRKIRELFDAKDFVNYQNAIMIGMRRVGKTTLLHYLCAFANKTKEDTHAVWFECGGESVKNAPIQTAFIDRVIAACAPSEARFADDGDELSEDILKWVKFINDWKLKPGERDRNPYDLKNFYKDLKDLTGKGLMLVIDEFDVLLGSIEQYGGVYETFFPALREMLNSPEGQQSVHFIICGSTWLMRYIDGGTLSQFFQQLLTNTIDVGNLPREDMDKMLTIPYKDSALTFTPGALDWIWKYTNGLVWYAKFIAKEALSIVKADRRNTVYSYDVVAALSTVAGGLGNHDSLDASHNSDEGKLLKEIRRITTKATEYVSLDTLCENFAGVYSRKEIERMANMLTNFKILAKTPYNDNNSYRFAIELYWHFHSAKETDYVKAAATPEEFYISYNPEAD